MNRLSPSVLPVNSSYAGGSADPPVSLELGAIERRSGHATPHALFVPMHYEPNYAYPLVVWLHGPGDDERQLQRVMPLISLRNYLAVAPRATSPRRAGRGNTWCQHEADIECAEAAVFNTIDLVSGRFNVAPRRVFIAGLAEGGTMAFRLALRNPASFAGVLSLGGSFPDGLMPLARLSSVRSLPLFIAQGRDSQRYTVDRTCEELRLFHAAGLAVTLRQYPCGDELTTHILADMDRWIMQLVTGIEHVPEEKSPHAGELN
jgi:phospholipase/carboxylesterase